MKYENMTHMKKYAGEEEEWGNESRNEAEGDKANQLGNRKNKRRIGKTKSMCISLLKKNRREK